MPPQLPPRLPMTPAVPLQVKQFSPFWLVSFPICRYEKVEEFSVHLPARPSHRSSPEVLPYERSGDASRLA